jgi:hypothetical protein
MVDVRRSCTFMLLIKLRDPDATNKIDEKKEENNSELNSKIGKEDLLNVNHYLSYFSLDTIRIVLLVSFCLCDILILYRSGD